MILKYGQMNGKRRTRLGGRQAALSSKVFRTFPQQSAQQWRQWWNWKRFGLMIEVVDFVKTSLFRFLLRRAWKCRKTQRSEKSMKRFRFQLMSDSVCYWRVSEKISLIEMLLLNRLVVETRLKLSSIHPRIDESFTSQSLIQSLQSWIKEKPFQSINFNESTSRRLVWFSHPV